MKDQNEKDLQEVKDEPVCDTEDSQDETEKEKQEPNGISRLDIENDDEDLDAFAQALLNRRTELIIFPEQLENLEEPEPEVQPQDRQETELLMSKALDQLRKERGQSTIAEEEQEYASHHPEDSQAALVHAIASETKAKEEKKKAKKEKKKFFPERKKSGPRIVKIKSESKWKQFFSSEKKRFWFIAACLVVILAAGLSIYAWKVLVYNPNNIVTEEQEKSYTKLVDYADEYSSGLMSDAEKAEIIDLKTDYDSLLQKQKDEINAYFKEQTSRNFMDIYNEELQKKQDQEDMNAPAYQSLLQYISNWNDKTDDEKLQILNYKSTYDSLSGTLKAEIDNSLKAQAATNFNTLYKEQAALASEAEQNQATQSEQQLTQWQTQLDALTTELNTYQLYAEQLQAQLEAQQAAGIDTTETEAAIESNNQMMTSLQNQINTLQHQIDITS